MPTLNRQQARELDRRAIEEFGIPGVVLMENAGRGVADVLERLGATSPVAVCCGKGNNAGDGFVIARHLDLRGIQSRLLVWARPEEIQGDARIMHDIVAKCGLPLVYFEEATDPQQLAAGLNGASWIVDALLGTGARGAPRPPLDGVIQQLNAHPAPILAVDVPSGLDCETGAVKGRAVRAAQTCTFVAPKVGFTVPGAEAYTGNLHVLDIGAPRCLVEEVLGNE